ncbi:MAG: DUF434 domain-containing protein [Lachnospiraceae bacterium]|nr:DUF434 domain-containing protein [Lachnospiraceae bacterium]
MNRKRGYMPEDDDNFSEKALRILRMASKHVIYLINEGYDMKQAYTFVGNHFMLSERQRLAIARSISTNEQLADRKAKELDSITGSEVWIDGFNTMITLEVMFSDSLLFSCMDGTIRDLAALRGTYRIIPETAKAVHMLFETLEEMKAESVHILLDEPVSNSGNLKAFIAEIGEGYRTKLDIRLLKEVDKTLWDKENVITSDAIVLDHSISWFNLIAKCVEKFKARTISVWN